MLGPAEDIKDSLIKSLREKEAIYSFLGRVYLKEIDEQLLNNCLAHKELFLKYKSITELDVNLKEGSEELYNYLSGLNEEKLNELILELAVDYANLFLGLKHVREGKGIPHPSESVYMTGTMYEDEASQVFNIYLEEGLIKSPEFTEPEDHIALELCFMAYLCKKGVNSLENGNFQGLLKYLEAQKNFLDEHLLKWIPKLTDGVIEYADTEFYRVIGKITKGVLNMDKMVVNLLIEKGKTLLNAHDI